MKLIAYGCAQAICQDILEGDVEPLDFIHHQPMGRTDLAVTNVYDDMGISIKSNRDDLVFLGDLSAGTQGTLLWIWYLALKIADYYNYEVGWQNMPAILMIDEIENHLHPTWQRRVIPTLLTYFEKLQIFATTHSPFVLAGLKRNQIHKLYREGDVIKTIEATDHHTDERIVGWTTEEILRNFMDVDDPTDEETAEAAATLRWLRTQDMGDVAAEGWRQASIERLTEQEAPTRDELMALRWLNKQGILEGRSPLWWQDAISELSGRVSRELEAGGPIAAQRELFLEQLAEMLNDDQRQKDTDDLPC